MITARFSSNEELREITLKVNGHAGYAERGKDIVCSAASILAYTLAEIVLHYETNLDSKPTIWLESGDTIVKAKSKDEDTYIKLSTALAHTRVGFALLEQSYPTCVSLIDFT